MKAFVSFHKAFRSISHNYYKDGTHASGCVYLDQLKPEISCRTLPGNHIRAPSRVHNQNHGCNVPARLAPAPLQLPKPLLPEKNNGTACILNIVGTSIQKQV